MAEKQLPACSLTARITEFSIPPVSDGLVIGKESPIGFAAIGKALHLLVADHYQAIEVADDVISHIIVRRNLLRRVPEQKLVAFVRSRIRPLMSPEEILHLELTAEVKVEDSEP